MTADTDRRVRPEDHALTLLAQGEGLKTAAEQSGLEVGAVVKELIDRHRRGATSPSAAAVAPKVKPEQLLEYYLEHPAPKVRAAAERLTAVYWAENGKAELRLKKQRLEAELAKVKAELAAGGKPAVQAVAEQQTCDEPGCGWTGARLSMHKTMRHKAA